MRVTPYNITVKAATPAEAFDKGDIPTNGYAYLTTPDGVDHQTWLSAVQQAAWDDYDIQPGVIVLTEHIGKVRTDNVLALLRNKTAVAVCVQAGDDEWAFLGTST
jgi:hypothetical protein